jgi:hypothetical protein
VGTEIDALSWGSNTDVFNLSGVAEGHSLARDIRPPHPSDTDAASDWFDNDPDFGRPTPDFSLPVTLSSLTATHISSEVMIRWTTETEVDHVGWDIYRSEKKDGHFVKINEKLIKGAGDSGMPRDYQYVDKTAIAGRQYYYYLKDFDIFGKADKSDIIGISKGKSPSPENPISTTWGGIKQKR